MKTNDHIVKNLKYYLKLDNPEHAFMITGDWGSGKTHFIDSFIDGYQCPEKKIIKISLFGLNSTSQIDQKIFEKLHPILGSKYARAAGSIIKGALSLGIRLDLDSDGSQETTANTKFDKFNLTDYLPTSGKHPIELVIVLDDLERTAIPLKEVLGFINYMAEISKFKVIILVNEKFILEGSEKIVYETFKEKVIGKTFEAKQNIDDFLEKTLNNRKYKNLKDHSEIIKDIYFRSKFKNLRNLKQTIDDFEFVTSYIEKKYLTNKEFYCRLMKEFFSLNLEIKKGNLNEESLLKNNPFMKEPKNKTGEDSIYNKYFFDNLPVFDGKFWTKIIFKGDISQINEFIEKLAYFIKKEDPKISGWIKLWNFRNLEDDEFIVLVEDLENEIRSLIENDLRIYFHKLALIIFFNKQKLCKITLDEIKNLSKKYVEKYKNSNLWKNNIVSKDSYFNGTGYAYYNYEDPDFIDLMEHIHSENRSAYEKQINQKNEEILDEFIENLKSGNIEYINNFILNIYNLKPIFHKFEPYKFADALMKASNIGITEFGTAISLRYLTTDVVDNRPKYELFKNELNFWKELKDKCYQDDGDSRSIKIFLLKSLIDSTIMKIIDLLSKD